MSDIIDLQAARLRKRSTDHGDLPNPVLEALDTLACALADHGHSWSDREVSLYETAVGYAQPMTLRGEPA